MKPYFSSILTIVLLLLLLTPTVAETTDKPTELYREVLTTYVKDGRVDYSGLKSNPEDLDSYLKYTASISKETFEKWSNDQQLAFLINLYNAHTLDLVADNYPLKSIKDIAADAGGPWEQPIVALFGEKTTLNALENEVIRKNYTEPRIHFALVCAAYGCPKLINEPYVSGKLDKQLEEQTRVFLMDEDKNSIDKKGRVLRLSPIFNWYKEDFILHSGSVTRFVNPYFGNEADSGFNIEYTNYDWTLNDLSSR